jgi:DNA polymerase-3 subunit alpha
MAKAPSELPFVHLRVRSAYSLLEGAITIPRIAHLATTNRMPAIALTDSNNLFGALEYSEAIWAAGIQPIIGCTLSVTMKAPEQDGRNGWHESVQRAARGGDGALALLVKDEAGYQNLMRLSSKIYLEHEDTGGSFVSFDDLAGHHQGLIVLTGGPGGPVDRALADGDGDKAAEWLAKLAELFGDRLYVELQRHGLEDERRIEPQLLGQAIERRLPVVATNDVFFAHPDEYEAHDALICIAEGSYVDVEERRRLSPEHYFKSPDAMASLFADIPEAIENTWEVARRCAFRPEVRKPILPKFASASGESKNGPPPDEGAELRRQAQEGLESRLAEFGTAADIGEDAYRSRLEHELDIITGMDYAGYFLIVADFIKWAKRAGIPVGPGRGSGAGSLVAWALTITDLDPLRFGLLFERFLNPERVSMPDFDIDFCQDRRDEVIQYVQETYGEDRVAQIITFGKLQARAVLRDVGRVLHMPYGQVDRLCKLIPYNPANPVTLAQAIDGEPRLQEARDSEPIVARLLDIALRLEGLYRHASTHAAGVVIGDRPLIELVPLYRDPRSSLPATQFNMKWVEAAGLVKFDFLGLKTLTVIEKTIEMVARTGTTIDPVHLPLDDEATYQLLARAETVGVFQLEGSGMRDSLRKLKPDRFEDIVAMVALYRPGPMDNIETYANRKHGTEKPDYLHPMIRPVLEETYGVIIYQEQVMQIAQTLSGFSLGEADLLRRAMGKKIKSEMDKQRTRFIEGAIANGVEKPRAEYIFEVVAKFAGYGFNKSHAAAYALLAYQTAYLKANHPVEFLAASMTLDMGNTDKLNQFVQEARRGGIAVQPPTVNASEADFVPAGKAIRYSLAALKNMGHAAAEQIQAERESNGPYGDVTAFARRLNPRAINKRSLEALITAGALDELGVERATLFAGADRILATANRSSDDRARGQNDLFGGRAQKELRLAEHEPWLPIERLRKEFEAVGFFLSGHPLDEYKTALDRLGVQTWAGFSAKARSGALVGTLAGTVIYRQERKSRSGNQFAFVGFSDQSGEFEAVAFSETLIQSRDVLEVGNPVLIRMEAELDGDVVKARLHSVEPLDQAAMRTHDGLEIVMEDPDRLDVLSQRLSSRGEGKVWLVLRLGDVDREVEFAIPGGFDTSPSEAGAIRHIKGIAQVTPR